MSDTNEAKRTDSSGRDVTELPGLWGEEDTNEQLGSSDGSSGMDSVGWLRIMAALFADDGKPHAVFMQASDRLEHLHRAAVAVLQWYFRDGSVGGAEDPMYELMRACGVTEEWLRRK